ncbi:glucosamine-6-phosphate deaminase [Actinacidiphila yanglinensis]|uniref:Glucosamine-6-phosphate deaminase n=1 Tax=Actinacidiphila yanglinensis TaxID=310779 RepID=A0A1H6DHE6_9ACTN|nr:6-phosphogluconolactonase [Actinacidiphila yanglinensis]SEG84213.1 glucosamine-6-phosphate deaminase [Actinacidiphila yanglinensis]
MRVVPTVFRDSEALGCVLAAEIADEIDGAARDGRRYVLGCPGGRSAHSTYRALADEVAARGLDLGHVVIVMMDEYVDRDEATAGYRRIDPELLHSCVRFGRREIVRRLGAAAGPGRGVKAEHFLVPDPAEPDAYDERIAALGGIDLFLLASGAGDGHIAFNPAGTAPDARTHVVALPEQTRKDNLATFPSFRGLDEVPRYGVTVGIGTIRERSKRVVMVAHGADKARAVGRLTGAEHYEPDWPATIFTDCARPRLYVDEVALKVAAAPTTSA